MKSFIDFAKLSKIISQTDWKTRFENSSIDDAYNDFLKIYEQACKESIPLKKHRAVLRPPWFNYEIKTLVKKKHNLWHSNQRTGWRITSLVTEYKQARNNLRKKTRLAIRSHEMEIVRDKKNPKRRSKEADEASRNICNYRQKRGDPH